MHLRRDTNIYAKNYNFPNPIGSKTRTLFYHFISLVVVVVVVLPYLYIYMQTCNTKKP